MSTQRMIAGWFVILLLSTIACNLNIAGINFSPVKTGLLRTESQTIELANAQVVEATLSMGMGELKVSGGGENLMDANFIYNVDAWKPKVAYTVDDAKGALMIQQPLLDNFGFPTEEVRNRWDLKLNDDVPLDLTLEIGGGTSDLDLRGLALTKLTLQAGAGEVHLNLADTSVPEIEIEAGIGEMVVDLTGQWQNDLQANISNGIGQLTLRLPQEVGVHIEAQTGIGDISSGGLHRKDGAYVNNAYETSDVTLNIELQGGVGEILLIQEG